MFQALSSRVYVWQFTVLLEGKPLEFILKGGITEPNGGCSCATCVKCEGKFMCKAAGWGGVKPYHRRLWIHSQMTPWWYFMVPWGIWDALRKQCFIHMSLHIMYVSMQKYGGFRFVIGVPPSSISNDGIFPWDKPSIFGGYPPFDGHPEMLPGPGGLPPSRRPAAEKRD